MTTETVPLIIPYEQQRDPANARLCGAACLSMVYRSFEKDSSQAEIWPAISKKNRFGSMAASTHLMTQDALNRGFQAVAVQTSAPMQTLRNCRESGIRAILNHLMEPNKPAGHYSVLVDVDDKYVYLHDPFFGPARRMWHAELLDLWRPQEWESEISGFVLIAINLPGPEATPKTECPACRSAVCVPPAALSACANICPACDHAWAFDGTIEPSAKRFDLSKVFGELDKFSSFLLSVPGVAEHPDVRVQLDALVRQKEKIQTAVKAFEQSRKIREQQMAAMEKSAKEAQEAHNKKLAELKAPMKQLDGHALGLALLKSLEIGAA
jgi:hypothetical protein